MPPKLTERVPNLVRAAVYEVPKNLRDKYEEIASYPQDREKETTEQFEGVEHLVRRRRLHRPLGVPSSRK
jgi:hypothetical protein